MNKQILIQISFAVTFYSFTSIAAPICAQIFRDQGLLAGSRQQVTGKNSRSPRVEPYQPNKKVKFKVYSQKGLQVFVASSGRKMIFDYRPPQGKSKKVMMYQHGLIEDMSYMEKLVERALQDSKDFGILRVDLHGHGQTLFEYAKNNNGKAPEKLDMYDNSKDIAELIDFLNIQEVSIIGHSLGGGVTYALATELKQKFSHKVKVHTTHLLATLAGSVDLWWQRYLLSSEFWTSSYKEVMADIFAPSMGLSKEQFTAYLELHPGFLVLNFWSKMAEVVRDHIDRDWKISDWMDWLLKNNMEKFMRKIYPKHLIKESGKAEADLTAEELDEIHLKTEAAIVTSRGIRRSFDQRGFEPLNTSQPIEDPGAPMQIIAGKEDKLVQLQQLRALYKRMALAGFPVEIFVMEGPGSDHLFPRQRVDETWNQIRDFMDRHP